MVKFFSPILINSANETVFHLLTDEMACDADVTQASESSESASIICLTPQHQKTDDRNKRPILDETENENKRSRIDDTENEYKESLKALQSFAPRATNSERRDPFFLALEEEFLKVPENRKSTLKLKLLTIIVEHQE